MGLFTPNFLNENYTELDDLVYARVNDIKEYNYLCSSRQYGKTLLETRILEEVLKEEQKRSELADYEFGIPEDRKYPLDSEKHVKSAIRLFGHAEESKKKKLAHRISKAADKYNIEIPKNTQCHKYLHESYIEEKQLPYSIITNNIKVTKSYGVYGNNGKYNAIVDINNNIRARGRSEILIIKNDSVFLSKSKNGLCGTYSVPGGGWDPKEPHDKAAIREAEEEVRIKTKNVKYANAYLSLYDEPHPWIKTYVPEEYWWRGYYTEVYVGEYNGKYNGKIDELDKDDLIKTGKFYKIDEVFDELHPIHQDAITTYLSRNESYESKDGYGILTNINIYKGTESLINESKDKSNYDSNFKKKTGGSFKYINFPSSEAKKYLLKDSHWNKESIEYFEDKKVGEIVIDKNKDCVAGYIFVNKSGVIAPLKIYDEYRGYGLSNKLVKDSISKYGGKELGVYQDNEVAKKLYEKNGFKTYKTKKYKDGDSVDIMRLDESYIEESAKKCLIISCYAGVGKNYSILQLQNNGYKVYSIEKLRDFYIKYPTPKDYVNEINKLSKSYDILFIPYFLNMESRYIQGKVNYYLIYPSKDCKSEYSKRFKSLEFTDDQIKYLLDNWEEMINDCKTCKIPESNKIELSKDEYAYSFIKNYLSVDESSSYNYFITNDKGNEHFNVARYIQMIMFQELDAYMVGNHICPRDIESDDGSYTIAQLKIDNEFNNDSVWNFLNHISNMVDNSVMNKYELHIMSPNILGVRVKPGHENDIIEEVDDKVCSNFGWTMNDISIESLNEVAVGTKVDKKYKIYYGDIVFDKTIIEPKKLANNRLEIEASMSFKDAVIQCLGIKDEFIKRHKDELNVYVKKDIDLSIECVIYELENDGQWIYKSSNDYKVFRRGSNAVIINEYEFDSVSEAIKIAGGIHLFDKKTKLPAKYLLEDDQIIKTDTSDNYAILVQDKDNRIKSVSYQMYAEFGITEDMIKNAEVMQKRNPELVIFTCNTGDKAALDKQFNQFKSLSEKQRKICNRLSLTAYGYNMYDMYNKLCLVVNKISGTKDLDLDPDIQHNIELVSTNINETLQNYMNDIEDELTSYGRDKSHIAEMLLDLYLETDFTFTESVTVKRFVNESIKKLESCEYDMDINKCAYFSPDKMISMGVFNDNPEDNYYGVKSNGKYKEWFESYYTSKDVGDEWINILREEYTNLEKDQSPENYQTILELGWNPELKPDTNTILEASNITKNDIIKNYSITNIDLTKIKWSDDLLSESMVTTNKELQPIFIITSYTETPFGKLIRKVSHSRYTHACISFDTSLENMYSFNADNNNGGGLSFESIKTYLAYNPDSIIKVQAIFVKPEDMRKIKIKLDDYIANYKHTKYSFKHCIDILLNRTRKGEDFGMICSEFVISLLRVADIDIVNGKAANIVSPKDLALSNTFNNKIYLIYEGLLENYNPKDADRLINKLYKNAKYIKECNLNDPVVRQLESYILQNISPIIEAKAEFDANGDLIISDFKKINFEEEYYHSSKLLKVYNKNNNYEGMKNELAKLWYLNSLLENKLFGTKFNKFFSKKDLDNYNKIRSKILNLFDRNLKIVTKNEPEFDFTSYYQDTKYYDNKVQVSKYTINGIIDNAKRIFR